MRNKFAHNILTRNELRKYYPVILLQSHKTPHLPPKSVTKLGEKSSKTDQSVTKLGKKTPKV